MTKLTSIMMTTQTYRLCLQTLNSQFEGIHMMDIDLTHLRLFLLFILSIKWIMSYKVMKCDVMLVMRSCKRRRFASIKKYVSFVVLFFPIVCHRCMVELKRNRLFGIQVYSTAPKILTGPISSLNYNEISHAFSSSSHITCKCVQCHLKVSLTAFSVLSVLHTSMRERTRYNYTN